MDRTTLPGREPVLPAQVHPFIAHYMLLDGYSLVMDLERSRGCRIYDSRGERSFLDFFSFFCTRVVGINHPKLRTPDFEAKLLRAAAINPTNSDVYTVEMAEFVRTFARLAVPEYLATHLFFISGGTLGVENAMKAAFDWKVRRNFRNGYRSERGHQVIYFSDAFHGRSGFCLSVMGTWDTRKYSYYPRFPWPRIDNPKLRFPVDAAELERVSRAEAEAVEQIKRAFHDHKDDIACIIIEPIQGEGGDNHFRPQFLSQLRTLADENEAMLIFDEVQTGMGSTGRMWAHEHSDVRPDLLAFGKKTQVCGVISGARIDEERENVFRVSNRIDSTWGGSLVDMVRCARLLEIIEEEDLLGNARRVGEQLRSRLERLSDAFPDIVSNVRGIGLMCAFDVATSEMRDAVLERAYANGLIVLRCGATSIRMRPPLDVTDAECEEACFLLERSLGELTSVSERSEERRSRRRELPSE